MSYMERIMEVYSTDQVYFLNIKTDFLPILLEFTNEIFNDFRFELSQW